METKKTGTPQRGAPDLFCLFSASAHCHCEPVTDVTTLYPFGQANRFALGASVVVWQSQHGTRYFY